MKEFTSYSLQLVFVSDRDKLRKLEKLTVSTMENSNGAALLEAPQNGVKIIATNGTTTNGGTNGTTNGKSTNGSANGSTNGVTNGKSNGSVKVLETKSEKSERTVSLIIVYFTLFLQSLGLAIAMTGVWPFLDKVS